MNQREQFSVDRNLTLLKLVKTCSSFNWYSVLQVFHSVVASSMCEVLLWRVSLLLCVSQFLTIRYCVISVDGGMFPRVLYLFVTCTALSIVNQWKKMLKCITFDIKITFFSVRSTFQARVLLSICLRIDMISLVDMKRGPQLLSASVRKWLISFTLRHSILWQKKISFCDFRIINILVEMNGIRDLCFQTEN
jgi:hypothetical protein